MNHLLDRHEKDRFGSWCEMQASTCEGMAAQMDKMLTGVTDSLAKRERMKAAAFKIVANEIMSGEEMSVGSGTTSTLKEVDDE